MVTQCTACLIWFKVTREQLHAAHGLVRCSACNTVFNALATLRHEMPEGGVFAGSAAAADEASADDSGAPVSREPEAPESDAEEGAGAADGLPEQAPHEGDEAGSELPVPDSPGRPEVEPYLGMPMDDSGPDSDSGTDSGPGTSEQSDRQAPEQEDLDELDLYMASALGDGDSYPLSSSLQNAVPDAGWDAGSQLPPEAPPGSQREADEWASGLESGEELSQQEAEGGRRDGEAPPAFGAERGHRWQRRLWGLFVGLAALVLAAQIVYAQRDALGRIFGLPSSEPMLNMYVITGATLDAARQPGALVLKGALVNRGRRGQPLPLIRVTLTDRYGDTVGARILSPREYGADQKTLLHAHQRFMFHVKLADPGSSAVGFSLVLCKHQGHSILCQDS